MDNRGKIEQLTAAVMQAIGLHVITAPDRSLVKLERATGIKRQTLARRLSQPGQFTVAELVILSEHFGIEIGKDAA